MPLPFVWRFSAPGLSFWAMQWSYWMNGRAERSTQNSDAPLTPDQQCTLQAMVKARVDSIPVDARPKGLFPQIWSRFNNHFRIARYCQLPQSRMSEAIEYLTKMEIVRQTLENPKPKALPAGYPPLAEAGASCMAEILNLRGSLFKASVDLKAVMQMGLSHGNGQNLGKVQRAFSESLGQSVDAFFMSINHNMIAIEHMFRAFMEAEKLIHG
ncbi:ORF6C domain-containing protein [Desulfovibrio sp. ZJ200]|uniref:ORF6C domain-containing protein n=1 Tax=Desulfovibrio sp. ZJ200 TaxID=2709792 RepID=UPI0013EA01CB|nr:ORF6C domain-containing protein [Desulfovibrio sp. ZJ200]